MEQKIVYFDQNAWIYLSQAYYGINTDEAMKKTCDLVIKLSSENKVIFPLSVVHLMETLIPMNKERRERLVRFMLKVSQGYTILPYREFIKNMEIEKAVLKKFGRPHSPMKDFVISRGISHLFASVPQIIGKVPDNVKLELIKTLESPETLLWLLTNEDASKFQENKYDDELIKKLESIRAEDSKIKDNELRRNVALFKYFINTILPEVIMSCFRFNLNGYKLFEETPPKREEVINFYKSISSSYTYITLTNARDMQKDRSITGNDINDIGFLSIAIPYCDIVVADKMMTSLAKSAGLNNDFDTVLLSQVTDLNQYLET